MLKLVYDQSYYHLFDERTVIRLTNKDEIFKCITPGSIISSSIDEITWTICLKSGLNANQRDPIGTEGINLKVYSQSVLPNINNSDKQ